MIHRARRAQRERLVRDLEFPRRFVVGMQQDVRMALDEAGRQRQAREIDHSRIGSGNVRRRAGCLDALAGRAYRPSFVHRLAVEDARGPKDDRTWFSCRRTLRGEAKDRCRQDDKQHQDRSRSHAARIVTF